MRVVAGSLGGRVFGSSAKSTHPMSEKMRGAIFNSLGDITGLTILDIFSGSGSISIEAISRGAAKAVAVESNKHAQNDISKNIDQLGIASQVKLIKANYLTWLLNEPMLFDIVIADPPYDDPRPEKLAQLEQKLAKRGTLVLSLPPRADLPSFKKLNNVSKKNYGDSVLVFYKNNL